MGKALPPPVAGRGHAHQARVLAVLHVAHQNAVLDQHVARRRGAFVIDADRAAPVGQGAVIQNGHAGGRHAVTQQTGEGRGFLAVEIAFQPVADRLVQQDAGPARPKDHIHRARRGGDGLQIDQRDAQRFARQALPVVALHQPGQAKAAAPAHAAAFAASVRLNDDRDVQAAHRADVRQAQTFGAQDLHLLQTGGQRGRHLYHAGVQRAGIGIDLAQHVDLYRKGRIRHRIGIAVQAQVGTDGGRGHRAATIAHGQTRGFRRPAQRTFGNFGGMGIACDLALHGAQPEAFRGIVAGRLDPAIVQNQCFGAAALQEQLAIFGPKRGRLQDRQRCRLVQIRLKRAERGVCHALSLGVISGVSLPQSFCLSICP